MARKQKYDYFDAYAQLSKLAVQEAEILRSTFAAGTKGADALEIIEEAHKLEHAGDLISHEIFDHIAVDFMPAIDREDIVDLTHAMDNILDCIEEVLRHFYMYDVSTMPEDAVRMAELIKKSCEALDAAMDDFRNFRKSKQFKQLIIDVSDCEEEADNVYMTAMRELHMENRNNENPMHVLVWSRIYLLMEKCCDACEHAADLIGNIVLKSM